MGTAKGFVIAEEGHVVNILPPLDVNGGATSDVFSMREHAHCSIILQVGASGGAVPTVTINACSDFTPSATSAIAFAVYKCETLNTAASGDIIGARTAETNAGFAMSTTDDIFYIIEIDAAELPSGYPCLEVVFSNSSASTLASAVAILSGSRYGVAISDTETA